VIAIAAPGKAFVVILSRPDGPVRAISRNHEETITR
jgi:hypothetical protein